MENEKANRTILIRTVVLMVIFGVLIFIPLGVKLYDIQITRHDELEMLAIEQQTKSTRIAANRGTIYDRNLNAIAISASVEMIFIDPKNIYDEKNLEAAKKTISGEEQAVIIAKGLSEILGLEYEKVYALTQKKSRYEIVAKKVEKELADQVRAFIKEKSLSTMVGTEPDSKRYYPYGNFAASLIGFVGVDNDGLEGIEAKYDENLKGTPGKTVVARDNLGNAMPYEYEMYYEATDGNDIVLTIDESIQHFLEKHIETALIENEVAKKACGIVMNVKTGAILAMTTKGDYDPNQPREITDAGLKADIDALSGTDEYQAKYVEALQSQWRNKAISDSYEPGSTFKIFTAAMALEENVVSERDVFNCTGVVHIGGWDIKCHKAGGHGTLSFQEALLRSCNPAFIAIGQRVGPDKFYSYMESFGFFDKTDIDIPGELSSYMALHYPLEDFKTDVAAQAVYSFGQTFKVTPLQIITAVSAVANGGNLMKPYVVSQLLDGEGNVAKQTTPTVSRKIISEETSKKLCMMLEEAVKSGTGSNAYVSGYRIAGKTGTSQKRDVVGAQDNGWYVVSFVGFAPADDPEIAVLIMLDTPGGQRNLRTGGYMAAPVARRVFADALPYLGIAPQYTVQSDVTVPNLKNMTVDEAKKALSQAGINYKIEGKGTEITDQLPLAGVKIPGTAQMIIYTEGVKPQNKVTVPSVIGKTPEHANVIMTNAGLMMKAVGATAADTTIKAAWQEYEPGREVDLGTIVQVEFRDDKVGDLG